MPFDFLDAISFAKSSLLLKILILAIGFIFTGCLLSHAVIALDKQKKVIAGYIFTAVTSLIGYIILIPRYSYFGAAWVTVYSELSIALFAFYVVRKYSGFRFKPRLFFKSLLASLIMGAGVYLLKDSLNIVVTILLAALIYGACLIFLKTVSKKDLIELTGNKYDA